jgi:CubicO group peptidase (beta-lactamase class C family)
MKLRSIAAAVVAVLAAGALSASAQVPQIKPAKAAPPMPAAELPAVPAATPTLTKQDLDSWLDGYMPYAISSGDIAGAVVVVVKDGQVLTEKGYGYADVKTHRKVDPKADLFRPGSISKLFTWTAVMQQVEAGKIDLDADVNKYLDFKIPPRADGPVTMRDLMTHTGGFAETIKGLFTNDARNLKPLGQTLAEWVPNRIFPAGEVPAYSNYGAALAGYIVQRVSGEKFEDYIQHHIFMPLDMQHASFRQPLEPNLLAGMSSGYHSGSKPAVPYEFLNVTPPGALAVTGDDMTRFMIAHLQNGAFGANRILSEATAKQMHAPQKQHTPPLNGMALGFYHEDTNGHVIVGHGGDLVAFHSDVHLLLNDNVGIFMSMNSQGKGPATSNIRQALLQGFMDRYYPDHTQPLPTAPTAKDHAAQMAGLYWSSRRADSGFLRAINLISQTKVKANPDGTIVVSNLTDYAGAPLVWREVGPYVWTDASGERHMAARVDNGKIVYFGMANHAAFMVEQPVPGWAKVSWNGPLFMVMLAVLIGAVVLWPIQALVRRRYGQSFALSGRTALLYRLVRLAALADLIALAGFVKIAMSIQTDLSVFSSKSDGLLRVLQLFCLLGAVGAVLSVWNAVRVWREPGRSWWAKVSVTLIMLALLAFVWFAVSLQLVSPSLNY